LYLSFCNNTHTHTHTLTENVAKFVEQYALLKWLYYDTFSSRLLSLWPIDILKHIQIPQLHPKILKKRKFSAADSVSVMHSMW